MPRSSFQSVPPASSGSCRPRGETPCVGRAPAAGHRAFSGRTAAVCRRGHPAPSQCAGLRNTPPCADRPAKT